ncbi:MAG: ATP-binding protein [Candidatus Pristimantibacillus lignocellulolyticus]|uniref:ATP-binding protein n=1 Tax=Candidatus Pristimantibacillus lignocellulolyticus TaxID=2994561 RepID=A0A9J6ZFX0_9BACL|nr:MAG: ATP-binding protein [Candidatus Pristimantibacillus lignocellulolyticus]
MKEIRLQIPAHADFIDIVRVCLFGIATKLSFSYEDIEDMKVAVSEACNNAVLYGSGTTEHNTIDICFESRDHSLTIRISNKGQSFEHVDALEKASPLPETDISELPVGGLGIYLMQALMDEVTVETNDNITQVTLVKFLTA